MKKLSRVTVVVFGLLFTLSFASFTAGQVEQAFFVYPDGPRPLSAKWDWALTDIDNSDLYAAWVVYKIRLSIDEKLSLAISSLGNEYYQWNNYSAREPRYNAWNRNPGVDANHWHNGLSIDALLVGNRRVQQANPRSQELLVIAKFEDAALAEINIVDAETVINWQSIPVYWLDLAPIGESFRLLAQQLDSASPQNLNRAILRGIGLHDDPDRFEFLYGTYQDADWKSIQANVVESIALLPSSQVEAFLIVRAENQNESLLSRRIAISALSRYESDAALETLMTLASPLNPQQVRAEAVESLGLFASDAVADLLHSVILNDESEIVREQALNSLAVRPEQFDTVVDLALTHANSRLREKAVSLLVSMDKQKAFGVLKEIVENDQSQQVREEAIEKMRYLPARIAVPYLLDFAESNLDQATDVRREAVEALAEFSPSLVIERLNLIAWGDASRDVREEAVESLAKLQDSNANALLLDIARNHPSSHTSREALDQLQDNIL